MDFPCEHSSVLEAAARDCELRAWGVDRINYELVMQLGVAPEDVCHVGTTAEALVQAHFRPAYRVLALYYVEKPFAPIGFLSYDRIDVDTVQLHILLIDAMQQSRGYGSAALRFVRRLAGILGARRVQLQAYDHDRLLRFYEKNGFQRTGDFSAENHISMAADAIPRTT